MSKTTQNLITLVSLLFLLYVWKQFIIPLVLWAFFWFFFLWLGKKIWEKIKRPKRYLWIAVVCLIVIICLFVFWFIELGWYLHAHWDEFTNSLISAYNDFKWVLLESALVTWWLVEPDLIDNFAKTVRESFSLGSFDWLIWSTFWGILNLILVIVYTILTIVYRKKLELIANLTLPKIKSNLIGIMIDSAYQYLKWLFILIILLSGIYYVWLALVWVQYAAIIAWASAIMTIVPTVWTILWAVWAVIATWLLTGSLLTTLFIGIWYFTVQQVEEYFILPHVVWKKVQLNVLTTITAIVFWGLLWWVAWIFLAIPIMGIIKRILTENWNKRWEVFAV